MELTKIKGSTYYINSPTNIGIYVFKNKNCLIIDTGINNTQARKINDVLINNNFHPKYVINTHSHIDHCGGNNFFKNNYTGCLFYSSNKEKVYMQNIELCFEMLSGSKPSKELIRTNKSINIDFVLDYGINKINDEKFEIIPLKGHTKEQIGIVTPEKVCFLADSVFSYDTMKKYSIPYLYDIEESINTLNTIKDIDADYFILGHGKNIIEKNNLIPLVDKNLANIQNYIDQILELLDQPLTKEDILQNLVILNDISMSFTQYHVNISTLGSFISYLYDKDYIDSSLQDGKLYFFKKA